MANGPGDYRDPKVTTTTGTSSMRWLWYVLGAILLLLLLGWLVGLFGADDAAEVETDGAVVVEETEAVDDAVEDGAVVVEDPAATDGAADTEQVVTEEGEAVVTEDGEPVVTEEGATD